MKYTEINVKPFVCVSSSCDYSVEVLMKVNGKPQQAGRYFCRRFHLNSEQFLYSSDESGYDRFMPSYAIKEVLGQLRRMIEQKSLTPYEYNRDGTKRWSNLRYYDFADLQEWADKWAAAEVVR